MIPQLADALRDAIYSVLEDRVAISFSGGIDSTLIASVAREKCDVELYVAGIQGSEDLEYAKRIAKLLSLPLKTIVIDKDELCEVYGRCYSIVPNEFLKIELLIPIWKILKEASSDGHEVMLFGSGSEELFAGYERYYKYLEEGKNVERILLSEFKNLEKREIAWIKKLSRHFSIDARFPFYNRNLSKLVFSIPLEKRMEEKELKKGILREAAALLGVPQMALRRKKRAMQYGSGIHKYLLKYSEELNRLYPWPVRDLK